MTWSIVQPLCDSWASCLQPEATGALNSNSKPSPLCQDRMGVQSFVPNLEALPVGYSVCTLRPTLQQHYFMHQTDCNMVQWLVPLLQSGYFGQGRRSLGCWRVDTWSPRRQLQPVTCQAHEASLLALCVLQAPAHSLEPSSSSAANTRTYTGRCLPNHLHTTNIS